MTPPRTFRGVLNVVHGTHDVVNRILDHPDIKAIAFVGSDQAGRHIYQVRNTCVYEAGGI